MPTSTALPRVPGPPILGNTLRLIRDPLGFTLECARRYGDLVDLNIPIGPLYLVSHPDQIEEVLVRDHRCYIKDRATRDLAEILGAGLLVSEGEAWRRMRRLAQPGFHRERVASYGEVMVGCAERMLDGWAPGQARDVHADMMALTRDIVLRTLFDADLGGAVAEIGPALEAIAHRFIEAPPGVPLLRHLPTPGKRRFERAARQLDAFIYRLIAERRASRREGGDLLSMLVSAADEDGTRMTDRQLRDEAVTLFLAGHETTAVALTWTWVLLARHPAAREALGRELDEVLGERSPTASDLPRLRAAEHVIQESMRLYPPVWAIAREAITPASIGGVHVPKGAQVWVGQYIVHRDRRFFDDPESFRPERWEGDLARRLPKYAYFPFGGGPRVCIGNAFAMMEAVLLLSTIARRFRLELVPEHPIEAVAAVTLRPRHGVRVWVERR
jgi:cytochrome P450